MADLVFWTYHCFATLLPTALVLLVLAYSRKKAGHPVRWQTGMLVGAFGLYIAGVFFVTGSGTLFDLMRYELVIRPDYVNFLPFSRDIDPVAYVLNVLMLVPLGMVTPLLWKRYRSGLRTVGLGLGLSLVVEFSQLANSGRTDVDDVILNTLGTVLGYLTYRCLPESIREELPYSPIPLIALLFVSRFLFFDEMGLARLLYGF